MKDKNGIDISCFNCDENARNNCFLLNAIRTPGSNTCVSKYFKPSYKACEARIADLEKKLTETIKLLSERSRECGELEAHNEVLQRRIREFSMELLDRTMKENKDVLKRLKEAESEEK